MKQSRSKLTLFPDTPRGCSSCKRLLHPSWFVRCQGNKDGLHSQCIECRAVARRADYANRREEFAAKHRIKTYGLDPATFARLVERQQNHCAICDEDFDFCIRHIDHDHETGQVRGLLCPRCNTTIGRANDDPALLRAMAAYIERHRARQAIEQRIGRNTEGEQLTPDVSEP